MQHSKIHNRQSYRLKGYDYSSEGSYFLTMCTYNRLHFFGEIENESMQLNELGKIAEHIWNEIPVHFPNFELDAFIVMPNHVHCILNIVSDTNTSGVGTRLIASQQNTTNQNNLENTIGGATGTFNPMFYQNVSRVIRWYKGRCSFEMRKIQPDFKWQSRFYDHIIREYDSYLRIANYINENPKLWGKDKFNHS